MSSDIPLESNFIIKYIKPTTMKLCPRSPEVSEKQLITDEGKAS
jgi:hypothetical protein